MITAESCIANKVSKNFLPPNCKTILTFNQKIVKGGRPNKMKNLTKVVIFLEKVLFSSLIPALKIRKAKTREYKTQKEKNMFWPLSLANKAQPLLKIEEPAKTKLRSE
jgi:hypothetical protein